MRFINTAIVALLGLGAMAFAAPVDTAVTDVADGCDGAYRGEHRACERGREQKHDGYREERKGEREIAHGNIGQGLRDERQGAHDVHRGSQKECRAGGRC